MHSVLALKTPAVNLDLSASRNTTSGEIRIGFKNKRWDAAFGQVNCSGQTRQTCADNDHFL
jgi:hypothetical protein